MAGLSKGLDRFLNFLRRLRLARARYGRSYAALIFDFFDLRRQRYTPKEIFLCDLLDRGPAAEKRQTTIGKAKLIALQQRINPPEAAQLVEDKSLFYLHCRKRGLAAPRLFALWEPGGGWTAAGAPLGSEGDWTAFLASLDVRDIVIKPSLGVYGRGIRILRRNGEQWRDHDDRLLSGADILRDLRHDPDFDRFVVQERIVPHPRLIELSGTDYVQSMRIATGVDHDGKVQIFYALHTLICGEATTSNFAWGATGNVIGTVELKSGTLATVYAARADGVGMVSIDRHPTTGGSFKEFAIPFWHEACDLCRRAAVEFLPLRTVGWDVAITPDGPVLIEGNAWWDPFIPPRNLGPFLSYARSMLGTS